MTQKLYTGEVRMVRFEITDTKDEPFTIGEAYYKVMLGSELVDSGLMDVEDNQLSFMFSPTKAGLHIIMIKYVIGNEVMKDRYPVEVVEG